MPQILRAKDLTGGSFRANPKYKLVPLERLSEHDRHAITESTDTGSVFGVLIPHDAFRETPMLVDRDTALLFYASTDPGPLPGYLHATHDSDYTSAVTALVLDGVLEVLAGGDFVTGPRAISAIRGAGAPYATNGDAISELSARALSYAALLRITDSVELSGRLYKYNTQPITAVARETMGSANDVANYLGVDGGGYIARVLGWLEGPTLHGAWISWRCRYTDHAVSTLDRSPSLHKLYVSPPWGQIRDVLEVIAKHLSRYGLVAIKVGRDLPNLLRPDKIVIHFNDRESLRQAVSSLEPALAGCPVQGVPFTAKAGADGLLSWGVDPNEKSIRGPESWRLWVTNRLALALATAIRTGEDSTAVDFARYRIELEGVDVATWTPSQLLFQSR